MTKQCEENSQDKTSMIAKLAKLQEDQRKLIDEVTDNEKRVKELGKVNSSCKLSGKSDRLLFLTL